MSKKNKKNKHLDQNLEATEVSLEATSSAADENFVNYVEPSSSIDISELRRAQQQIDSLLDDEEEEISEDDDRELSLDEQAALIRKEMDSDSALKVDVLEGFNAEENNENLDRIASKITAQEKEQLETYAALASDVSEELKLLNDLYIAEDRLLESTIAREAEMEMKSDEEAALIKAMNDREALNAAFGSLDDDEEGAVVEEMSEEDTALKSALPQADENGNYDMADLQSCIEALLFYSDRSVSLKKLKEMLEMTEADNAPILEAIEMLKASYASSTHGFEVAEIAGGYQLRTKPSKAPLLRKLAKVQVQRLSRGAMETMTIVAYKQPCTKDDIDQVRGVDSSHFIRTLLDRKLIEVSGRSEAAGRPMIYATTDTFLEVFGLMDLSGMPPLREIEAMVPQMAAAEAGGEDPRVVQMRKMVHQMKTESNHLDYSAKEDEVILQEIKERVKAIDITTPYLARQKQLAEEGITGEEAEEMLAKEFGFDRASAGGEMITSSNEASSEESAEHVMTSDDQTELSLDSEDAEVPHELHAETSDSDAADEYSDEV
jgi:segregation and condensation protein B